MNLVDSSLKSFLSFINTFCQKLQKPIWAWLYMISLNLYLHSDWECLSYFSYLPGRMYSQLNVYLHSDSECISHFTFQLSVPEHVILIQYIVTCQRDGVSKEPPWLQAATRHVASDPLVRLPSDNCQKLKKKRLYTGPVLLRQEEPGTSQYIYILTENVFHISAICPGGCIPNSRCIYILTENVFHISAICPGGCIPNSICICILTENVFHIFSYLPWRMYS